MKITILVPNKPFDMPIYEGPDYNAHRFLVPGEYAVVNDAGVAFKLIVHESVSYTVTAPHPAHNLRPVIDLVKAVKESSSNIAGARLVRAFLAENGI